MVFSRWSLFCSEIGLEEQLYLDDFNESEKVLLIGAFAEKVR
jgi:hypothetical protein